MLDRLEALENKLAALESREATGEDLGLVRLSDSSAVTDTMGLALAATEKNAAVSGTIMNKVSSIDKTLSDFMNGARVMAGYIGYKADNKESALNAADNPTTVIGNAFPVYAILFNDTVGDSPFGGGECLLFGYSYPGDSYGVQIRIKYDSVNINIRRKTAGTWSEWRKL